MEEIASTGKSLSWLTLCLGRWDCQEAGKQHTARRWHTQTNTANQSQEQDQILLLWSTIAATREVSLHFSSVDLCKKRWTRRASLHCSSGPENSQYPAPTGFLLPTTCLQTWEVSWCSGYEQSSVRPESGCLIFCESVTPEDKLRFSFQFLTYGMNWPITPMIWHYNPKVFHLERQQWCKCCKIVPSVCAMETSHAM